MTAGIAELLPLGPTQRAMLAEEIRHPGQSANLVRVSARIDGPMDPDALRTAWGSVLARHACLRSGFAWEGLREPVQVVRREVDSPLQVTETEHPAGWLSAAAGSQAAQLRDLRAAPLVRLAVAHCPDGSHVMSWTYHHLVLDGWSSALVMSELLAGHDALVRGAGTLAPPVAYESAVDRWRIPADELDVAHWRSHLADLRAATDRRPDGLAPRPAAAHLPMPGDLADALGAFGASNRLTLATLVHAAWASALAARAGVWDVLLGSVDAGRSTDLPGVEQIVGPLLRTVPVRVRIPPGDWDRAGLAALQADIRAGARHVADLDWPGIAALAGLPARSAFDSLVTVENYPRALWRPGGGGLLRLRDVEVVETPAAMLVLEAVPADPGVVLRLVHDSQRIDTGVAHELLAEMVASLSAVVAGRDVAAPVAPAPMPEETIPDRWARTAATHAGLPAASDIHTTLTYAQLDRAAQEIAGQVRDQRATARSPRRDGEPLVGILVSRTVALPAAILGVLIAGAAYVPLDPGAPDAALARVASRAGLAAIVVTPDLAERAEALGVPLLVVGAGRQSPAKPVARLPDDAAYVIHTSGSTGVPKGVVVSHRNVLRLLDRVAEVAPTREREVWSSIHSAAFDFSVWEVLGCLLSGAHLMVVPEWVTRDPQELLRTLAERRVSVLSITPTAFAALAPAADPAHVAALALRAVVFGGERLAPHEVLGWQRIRGRDTRWLNLYGITETTVHATIRTLDPVTAELARESPIGAPLGDLRLDLLDPAGDPVAPGQVGELHVSGPGLARGYLDDPRLTADRFRPDPIGVGARRYRSGDLAVALPGGDLGYRGRRDRQVKVRGHRVEPGELEAVLRAQPEVGAAGVVADGAGVLHAWVTPGPAGLACRRLLHFASDHPRAKLVELGTTPARPGDAERATRPAFAVLHNNSAEALFTGDEVLAGSYLGPGLALAPDDTVLDVGANVGVFAVWAHLRSPGIRVHALEPVPEVAALLVSNLAAHGVAASVHEVAAGASDGRANVTYYPNATVISGAAPGAGRAAVGAYLQGMAPGSDQRDVAELLDDRLVAQEVQVAVRSLASLIAELGLERIDLLKVDVEGAELDVLAGLDDSDWARISRLVVEVHGHERAEALAQELRARGYWTDIEVEPGLAGAGLVMLHARTPAALARDLAGPRGGERVGDPASDPGTPAWHSPAALVAHLRGVLAEQLPDHLRPRTLQVVAALPTTATGKLDAAALLRTLAEETPAAGPGIVRPGPEQALVAAWGEIFDVAVQPSTDFFAAGGDSILCLTMLSRLRGAGWSLTPRQVFELRTPARLADVARPVAPTPAAPINHPAIRGDVEVPLTAIQRWFLGLEVPNRSHWNQAVLIGLPAGTDPDRVRIALQRVAERHDAFRLRLRATDDGWQQVLTPEVGPLGWTVQGTVSDAATVHHSLDLANGPVLAGALIAQPPPELASEGPVVLLVAHHLVIDAHSWAVLLRELGEDLAGSPAGGAPPALTFQDWASAESRQPPASPQPGLDLESRAQRVVVDLDPAATRPLGAPTYRDAGIGPAELALAAVAYAVGGEQAHALLELEGHGRDDPRTLGTIGWFTRLDPVNIAIPASQDPIDLVHATARSLRDLRRWGPRGSAAAPRATFNYIGEVAPTAGPIRVLETAVGELHDPAGRLARRLTFEVGMRAGRLHTQVIADAGVGPAELAGLVERYRQALSALALAAAHPWAGPSPLDLPDAQLSGAELAELAAALPELVDAYPLTPMQAGLLFHSQFEDGVHPYVNQFHWTVVGDLDLDALGRAWEVACQRHAALRTGAWTHAAVPHQVVSVAGVPLRVAAPAEHWDAVLTAERSAVAGCGPQPLTRLAVVPLADAAPGALRHRVVWTHHHLVVDGWSAGIVLADLHHAYSVIRQGGDPERTLPASPPPFRDYVSWLAGVDRAPARRWWTDYLQGTRPAGLAAAVPAAPGQGARPELRHHDLGAAEQAEVEGAGRAGITLNTLALAAWALTLAPLLGPDLVIGNTVSGRSAQPAGPNAQDMVGALINTLPVRARIDPGRDLANWLAELQAGVLAVHEHEAIPLAEILAWVGAAPTAPLFDTAVVVENLPEAAIGRRDLPGLAVEEVASVVHNHFTATLRVVPHPRLALELLHDPTRLAPDQAGALLARASALLPRLARAGLRPGATVGSLLMTDLAGAPAGSLA